MSELFIKYFEKRFSLSEKHGSEAAPVVTISRNIGCHGKAVAHSLSKKLNEYYLPIGSKHSWRVISKEILEEVARELKTDSKSVSYIFDFEKRTLLDDFILSMSSRQHHPDWQVRNAIKKVIYSIAGSGYTIILGRAGAQITRDLEPSLHVRLFAPVSWRVEQIKEKYDLTEKEAAKKVKEMDANREKLIKTFSSDEKCDDCYDVIFNMKYFSVDEIVSDIIHLMQLKKLI